VRKHQRLGAAVRGGGEQFKGAAAVGLGGTAATVGVRHGVSGGGGSEPGRSRIPRRAYIFFRNPKVPLDGGLIAKVPSRGRCPPAVRGGPVSGAAAQLITLPRQATVQADKRK